MPNFLCSSKGYMFTENIFPWKMAIVHNWLILSFHSTVIIQVPTLHIFWLIFLVFSLLPRTPVLPTQLFYITSRIIFMIFSLVPLFQGMKYSIACQTKSKIFVLVFKTFIFLWSDSTNAPELPTQARSVSLMTELYHSFLCGPFPLLTSFACFEFLFCYTWINWVLLILQSPVYTPSGCVLPQSHRALHFAYFSEH